MHRANWGPRSQHLRQISTKEREEFGFVGRQILVFQVEIVASLGGILRIWVRWDVGDKITIYLTIAYAPSRLPTSEYL